MTIDLSLLPAPQVIEPLDYDTILASIKADFLARFPEMAATLALESEPVTKLLEVVAYRELLLRARINDAAKSTMLAYARASDLDHLAALLGVQRLAGEEDDRFRQRTQLSLEGHSTAGPQLSYAFHALSASTDVADVSVDSPAPGQVRVTVLAVPTDDNPAGLPDVALLTQVDQALNAEAVRPLTDQVIVQPAQVLTYAVSASLICQPGPDVAVIMAAAHQACERYTHEQFRLGYDITLSGLHAALHQPGVSRVDLHSPANNLVVSNLQAARCTGIDLVLAGVGV